MEDHRGSDYPEGLWYAGLKGIQLLPYDNEPDSGVNNTFVIIDYSEPFEYPAGDFLAPEEITLIYWSIDNAGNVGGCRGGEDRGYPGDRIAWSAWSNRNTIPTRISGG